MLQVGDDYWNNVPPSVLVILTTFQLHLGSNQLNSNLIQHHLWAFAIDKHL